VDFPKNAKLTVLGVPPVFQGDNTGETPMPPWLRQAFLGYETPRQHRQDADATGRGGSLRSGAMGTIAARGAIAGCRGAFAPGGRDGGGGW